MARVGRGSSGASKQGGRRYVTSAEIGQRARAAQGGHLCELPPPVSSGSRVSLAVGVARADR